MAYIYHFLNQPASACQLPVYGSVYQLFFKHAFKSLLEIGLDIIDVLDAHAYPHLIRPYACSVSVNCSWVVVAG